MEYLSSGSASITRRSFPVLDNNLTKMDETKVLPVPPFPLTAIINLSHRDLIYRNLIYRDLII